MTDLELLGLYDRQLRGGSDDPGTVSEQDGPLVRVTGGHPGSVSGAPDLGVRGAELDALIARQVAHFAARGEALDWQVRGHDRPAELPDRLLAAGFVPQGEATVLAGETARFTAAGEPPAGVLVRRTADPADAGRIAALYSEVWRQDLSFIGALLRDRLAHRPELTAVVLAEAADGALVSAGWLKLREGTDFAGLLGGSTLAPWRGRGIYRALVAERARIAEQAGRRYLKVDASADSAPILRGLGFRQLTTRTIYRWTPPPNG
ncbi:GNAT family N-acetyltransferase [Kitasatospora sp. NPDC006697]|uniref:GNAT family N-acetyltransferase n=1 Tax=Kitasatospora sp. NPDC006697 TaxID=3364020 RepID=UPI0036A5A343